MAVDQAGQEPPDKVELNWDQHYYFYSNADRESPGWVVFNLRSFCSLGKKKQTEMARQQK